NAQPAQQPPQQQQEPQPERQVVSRSRSRNPKAQPTQQPPQQQQEPQPERRAVSRSRSRNPKAQPDQPPTKPMSRRWKGNVLQVPGVPRLTLTNKDRNPALSRPQLLINQDLPPTQLGATTSSSETGKVPSRPFRLHLHPANKNQRQLLSRKPNKQHDAPRK
ncbi:MAG: hypothetical protein ACKPKO_49530, partial [Candidatus Fonsibacter sp.]